MSKIVVYPITPVPKPRMTTSDRWNKRPCVQRYWSFKDECKLRGVVIPDDNCGITFCMPMPKSWSKAKKERMLGKLHKQTPDIDNLLKGLLDAIRKKDEMISSFKYISKTW